MSITPPVELPDWDELAGHGRAFADGIQLIKGLPAFNDPHIAAKLNRISENTDNIRADLHRSLSDEFARQLEGAITRALNPFEARLTAKINTVKNDLTENIKATEARLTAKINAVETSVNTVKNDLTEKIDAVETSVNTVKNDLTEKIKATETRLTKTIQGSEARLTKEIEGSEARLTKEIEGSEARLTEKINAVEKALKTNIAARSLNSIIYTRNTRYGEARGYLPLRSVFTDTPIANFPTTRAKFQRLTTLRSILRELDDPYHNADAPQEELLERLHLLAGLEVVQIPRAGDPNQ
ncbi:hypothetical protein F5Y14DRAFT_289929 [Nemania sp. NC0429]|nr:hypothetical protein F5Y14DRAFT_289929 [Nemania sp. NC0429]